MKLQARYTDNRHPANPKYPNGWRGAATLALRAGNTVLRLRWNPAHCENDWMRVDPYKRINIAPVWAKWFSFVTYYRGQHRWMHHLTIGHFGASYIPLTMGDACWWD